MTVKIDGVAASAASVIAMAGTEVLMAPTALMMIHKPDGNLSSITLSLCSLLWSSKRAL